ncbi:MAG: hypothetical protein WBJ10_12725 [Daejeonella sp.]
MKRYSAPGFTLPSGLDCRGVATIIGADVSKDCYSWNESQMIN